MQIGITLRDLARVKRQRTLSLGHDCASYKRWPSYFWNFVLPHRAHFWCKAQDRPCWSVKISISKPGEGHYVIRFLDDPETINIVLTPARYLPRLMFPPAPDVCKILRIVLWPVVGCEIKISLVARQSSLPFIFVAPPSSFSPIFFPPLRWFYWLMAEWVF